MKTTAQNGRCAVGAEKKKRTRYSFCLSARQQSRLKRLSKWERRAIPKLLRGAMNVALDQYEAQVAKMRTTGRNGG